MKTDRKIEFTEAWIKSLPAAAKGTRDTYTDLLQQGYRLRVNDRGEKVFSIQYRLDATREPKTHTLGSYPHEHTIATGRRATQTLLPLLKAGKDPKVEARTQAAAQKKIAANRIMLKDAAPLYVAYFRDHKPGKNGKVGRRSWESEQSKLINVVCVRKGWGERYVDEITDTDAAKLLDSLRDDCEINPNRIHSTLIQFWVWLQQPGHEFERPATNPFLLLDRRGEEKERDRTLSPAEIAYLWALLSVTPTFGNGPRSKNTRRVLMLLLLTAQRLSQILYLRRHNIQVAPDGTPVFVWSAEEMKADKEFVLPMSKTVYAIVQQALRETNGDLLFPSLDPRCLGQEMVRTAPWTFLNNLVKASDGQLAPAAVHDIRATGATMLYVSEEFEAHEIAKILSHAMHVDKRIPKSTPRYIRSKNTLDRFRGLGEKVKLVTALERLILDAALPGDQVVRLQAA